MHQEKHEQGVRTSANAAAPQVSNHRSSQDINSEQAPSSELGNYSLIFDDQLLLHIARRPDAGACSSGGCSVASRRLQPGDDYSCTYQIPVFDTT